MAARRKTPVVVGTLLAVALVGTVFASAPGTVIRMGVYNTITGNYATTLQGAVSTMVLQVRNSSTSSASAAIRAYAPYGGVPLDLRARSTNPVMRVSNSIRVPNLNADKVDGYDANSLVRTATASSGVGGDLFAITTNYPTYQNTITLSITAPTSGFVLINAGASVENGGACSGFACGIFLRIQHSATSAISPYVVVDADNANSPDNAATVSYVFPVSAGPQAFILQMTKGSGGTQTMYYFSANANALFVPFGSTGTGTLGASVQKPNGASKGAGGLPK
jgi:hypothetical protein